MTPLVRSLITAGPAVTHGCAAACALDRFYRPFPLPACLRPRFPASSSSLPSLPRLSSAFHSALPLHRLRRVVRDEVVRTRPVDDSEYIHYTERIVYSAEVTAPPPPSAPPLLPPPSDTARALPPSLTPISSSSSPLPAPPPSSSARRAALYAAREARESVAAISAAWHSSGDSARVRRWHREQKNRRSRADRRRRKYAERQNFPRMEGYRAEEELEGDDDVDER